MAKKESTKTFKVSPVKDFPFHETKGVKLWGFQFNIEDGKLVAELSKEDADNFTKAGHVKEL